MILSFRICTKENKLVYISNTNMVLTYIYILISVCDLLYGE